MRTLRNTNRTRKGKRRKFASGKNALAICDRSGFQYPMREMVRELGTGLLVHRSESDGCWNRVTSPRNYPPDTSESIGLENTRPARIEPEINFVRDEDGDLILNELGQPIFYVED